MLIIIVLAVAVIVAGFWLFNATARGLINAATLNTAAWIVNHIPAVSTIFIIVGIIILLPILLGASWIYLWTSIGSWALSPLAGWIIGIGSLVGIFFLRKVVKPLILIAILVVVFGLCFPILKGSINRYGKAQDIQSANDLDLKTLKMQPQGVADGVVNENATLHDDSGKPIAAVAEAGKPIKTVSLEKRQFAGNPETFVKIMLPNINGDFYGGSAGWIPVRKVDWGVTKLGIPPPPDEKNVEKRKGEERWEYSFIHPDGRRRAFPVLSFRQNEQSVEIETELFNVKGTSDDGINYVGEWFQGGIKRGEMREFHFSESSSCWEGQTRDLLLAERWKNITLCKK